MGQTSHHITTCLSLPRHRLSTTQYCPIAWWEYNSPGDSSCFVETPEELAHLQQAGCKQMQGYFFSKPVSESVHPCRARERHDRVGISGNGPVNAIAAGALIAASLQSPDRACFFVSN
ncbi:MAG: hypothetical protein EBE86_024055 [Hormoscilla sp. GUM202]|nr:hypothetical protein [Hormoscilla sp. GUM202]